MRTPIAVLLCLLTTVACTAHRAPVASTEAVPADKPFVMAIAPFHVPTPGAEAEAQAERVRTERVLTSLVGAGVVKIVQASGMPPSEAQQAVALARASGADGILWGSISLQEGKLTFQRSFHDSRGWNIGGSWSPTSYVLTEPGQERARDKDVRGFLQMVLYGVNLAFMLDYQPEQSRRVLEALRPGQDPEDFATRNEGLIHRRWGMQGRLLRDGKMTETHYRAALAWVDAQRKLHAGDADYRAGYYDGQEALYTVGVARGLLLQSRPRDVIPLLSRLLERNPAGIEEGQLLGRALLAVGEVQRAARVLEPVTRQGFDTVSARLYAAAVSGQPDAAARTREAFATLFSKLPEVHELRLLPYLASAGAETEALNGLAAATPANPWPTVVARVLLGQIDEASLGAGTTGSDSQMDRSQRCWVHYSLGEAELAGLMPGRSGSPDREAARRHFEAAIATHSFASDAYHLADFQLEQLQRFAR